MRIAVLAWGSLIRDRGELALADGFRPHDLQLSVEFCRISGDGRLTLVIDEILGSSCTIYVALSAFGELTAAIENLSLRERMPDPKSVGFVESASGRHGKLAMQRHPRTVATIKTWARANGFDAAIWTALAAKFHKAYKPFSVEAALRYLESLGATKLAPALDYIRSAPPEVRTPVRAAVEARWPRG